MKAKGKAQRPAQAPAERNRLLATAGLAAAGLAISVYLTIVHYSSVALVCLGASGCEEVNRSIYSQVAGAPVALLGAGAYAAILAALWTENQKIVRGDEALLAIFGFSLAGVLYSAYLTFVELFILRAVCLWCALSALAITAVFALSVVRLRAALNAEARPAKGKAR